MCCRSQKSRSLCLDVSGTILLLVGAVVGGCWIYIYDAIVRWQLVLTPTSTTFDIWDDIPIPIYMEFTLFNVTNSAKITKNPSVIPEVVEMGPYVFREYHKRVDVTWNDHNNTVSYRQIRTFVFQPHLSGGSLSDEITSYNVIALTTAYGVRFLPKIVRQFVSRLIEKTNSTLMVTHTAGEWLFDGYDDSLLEVALQLNSTLFTIPFERFAYFAERNGSAEYDGWFNMYTGKDTLKKMGLHHSWNFDTHTPFYDYPCNEVAGSSGELWPVLNDYRDAEIFVPDLCITVKLPFNREVEFLGIPGLEYEASNRTLDNGHLYPETKCTCTGECVPYGALNLSLCRWNAPLILSQPHFLHADPVYLTHSVGLDPDPDKHGVIFALNPTAGVPLYANARFQLSIMMDKFPNIKMFEKVNQRSWVPLLWFNQRVELTEDLGSLVKLLVIAPQLGAGIFFGIAAIGTLLLLADLMLRLRPFLEDPEERAPLLSSEADPAAK